MRWHRWTRGGLIILLGMAGWSWGGLLVPVSAAANAAPYFRQFWSEVPPLEGGGAVTWSDMVVGDEGRRVYVAGWEELPFQASDYLLRCLPTDGQPGWLRRYGDGPGISHRARHVWATEDGGVLLTGDTVTLRYDREGNLRWGVPYPGKELLVGEDGTIYVSGRMGWNLVTAALDPDGKVRWTNSLPRVAGGDRYAGPQWSVWETYSMVEDGDKLIQMIYQDMAYPSERWNDGIRMWMGMRWMDAQGRQTRVQHIGSLAVRYVKYPPRALIGRYIDNELFTAVELRYEIDSYNRLTTLWHRWGLGTTNPVQITLPAEANLTPYTRILPLETGGMGVVLGNSGHEQFVEIRPNLPIGFSPKFGGRVFGSWTQRHRVIGLAKVASSGTTEKPRADLEVWEYQVLAYSSAAFKLEAPAAREWKPVIFGEDPRQPGRLLFLGEWTDLEGESRWMTGWYSKPSQLTVTGWSPLRLSVSGPALSTLKVETSSDLLTWREAGALVLDRNGTGNWASEQPMEPGFWRLKQP